jgi:hypothetical protein
MFEIGACSREQAFPGAKQNRPLARPVKLQIPRLGRTLFQRVLAQDDNR